MKENGVNALDGTDKRWLLLVRYRRCRTVYRYVGGPSST